MEWLGVYVYLYFLTGSIFTALECERNQTTVNPLPTVPAEGGSLDDAADDTQLASHSIFTIVIVLGAILLPMTVLIRLCWMRKLQKRRELMMSDVRGIVDQRLQEQSQSHDIFTVDIDEYPFSDMLNKPPSYEDSIANPTTGCPPPYDTIPVNYQQDEDHCQAHCSTHGS